MSKFSKAISWCVYIFFYSLGKIFVSLLFPLRRSGYEVIPKTGGALILSNHQSYLDPILIGLTTGRRCCYLARSSLFRFPPFRWIIRALGAIPISREGVAKEGLKKALEAVNSGELVLIFPEGTRAANGEIGEVKPGVLLIVRRSDAKLIVAGIDGAYESWPRDAKLPIPKPIWVHYQSFERQPEKVEQSEELSRIRNSMLEAQAVAKKSNTRLIRADSTLDEPKKEMGR